MVPVLQRFIFYGWQRVKMAALRGCLKAGEWPGNREDTDAGTRLPYTPETPTRVHSWWRWVHVVWNNQVYQVVQSDQGNWCWKIWRKIHVSVHFKLGDLLCGVVSGVKLTGTQWPHRDQPSSAQQCWRHTYSYFNHFIS